MTSTKSEDGQLFYKTLLIREDKPLTLAEEFFDCRDGAWRACPHKRRLDLEPFFILLEPFSISVVASEKRRVNSLKRS